MRKSRERLDICPKDRRAFGKSAQYEVGKPVVLKESITPSSSFVKRCKSRYVRLLNTCWVIASSAGSSLKSDDNIPGNISLS